MILEISVSGFHMKSKKDKEKSNNQVQPFKNGMNFNVDPKRSALMSKIKGKNTKPEIALRKALWALGVRYRLNYKKLPGCPDIVIHKYKLAIFVDGEFWHGYNWEEKRPKIKTNREYWIPKIEKNMQRDKETNDSLQLLGYKVIRFWDFEVNNNLPSCINLVVNHLNKV